MGGRAGHAAQAWGSGQGNTCQACCCQLQCAVVVMNLIAVLCCVTGLERHLLQVKAAAVRAAWMLRAWQPHARTHLTKLMCTPRPLCLPLHSRHMKVP